MKTFIKKHASRIIWILLLIFALVPMYTNVVGFPAFEGDEGAYIPRAWAFLNEGKLDTETYWYDHAPLGWIFLSFWYSNLNNLFNMYSLLISGRIFILFLNTLNLLFLYLIAYKLTKNKIISAFSIALYSTSALQILFGRTMILDNIMIFWILLVIFIHTNSTLKQRTGRGLSLVLGSIVFAIATLTKENAVFYGLPLVLLVWYQYKSKKAVITWLVVAGTLISLYPLFAYSRGELFLNNYFEEGGKPSLLSTLEFQSQRGKISILNWKDSFFWQSFRFWIKEDLIFIIAGIASTIANFILIRKDKIAFIISLFVLIQFAFFMRGGLVFNFYVIAILPFLALNISYFFYKFKNNKIKYSALGILLAFNIVNTFNIDGINPFITNMTKPQLKAIEWIKSNSSKENITIVDSYAKADLYPYKGLNVQAPFDIQYKWDLRHKIDNEEEQVDYILYSKNVEDFIDIFNLDFTKKFIENSETITEFGEGENRIEILKVNLKN